MPTPEIEKIPEWIIIASLSLNTLWLLSFEIRLGKIKKLIMQSEQEEENTQDGEPVPPDPNTATPKQIAFYKEQVDRAASTPPGRQE